MHYAPEGLRAKKSVLDASSATVLDTGTCACEGKQGTLMTCLRINVEHLLCRCCNRDRTVWGHHDFFTNDIVIIIADNSLL